MSRHAGLTATVLIHRQLAIAEDRSKSQGWPSSETVAAY
jgi:hypothetical protein